MSIYVYHESEEVAQVRIDGASFAIPSHELFPIEDVRGTDCNNSGPIEYRMHADYVADKICEHAWYLGMQKVTAQVGRDGKSVKSDLDAAKAKAKQLCQDAEDRILQRYLDDQMERLRGNLPAVPPSGRITQIIKKRNINLAKDYNINPPGYAIAQHHTRDDEMAAMKAQIDALTAIIEKQAKREKVHA